MAKGSYLKGYPLSERGGNKQGLPPGDPGSESLAARVINLAKQFARRREITPIKTAGEEKFGSSTPTRYDFKTGTWKHKNEYGDGMTQEEWADFWSFYNSSANLVDPNTEYTDENGVVHEIIRSEQEKQQNRLYKLTEGLQWLKDRKAGLIPDYTGFYPGDERLKPRVFRIPNSEGPEAVAAADRMFHDRVGNTPSGKEDREYERVYGKYNKAQSEYDIISGALKKAEQEVREFKDFMEAGEDTDEIDLEAAEGLFQEYAATIKELRSQLKEASYNRDVGLDIINSAARFANTRKPNPAGGYDKVEYNPEPADTVEEQMAEKIIAAGGTADEEAITDDLGKLLLKRLGKRDTDRIVSSDEEKKSVIEGLPKEHRGSVHTVDELLTEVRKRYHDQNSTVGGGHPSWNITAEQLNRAIKEGLVDPQYGTFMASSGNKVHVEKDRDFSGGKKIVINGYTPKTRSTYVKPTAEEIMNPGSDTPIKYVEPGKVADVMPGAKAPTVDEATQARWDAEKELARTKAEEEKAAREGEEAATAQKKADTWASDPGVQALKEKYKAFFKTNVTDTPPADTASTTGPDISGILSRYKNLFPGAGAAAAKPAAKEPPTATTAAKEPPKQPAGAPPNREKFRGEPSKPAEAGAATPKESAKDDTNVKSEPGPAEAGTAAPKEPVTKQGEKVTKKENPKGADAAPKGGAQYTDYAKKIIARLEARGMKNITLQQILNEDTREWLNKRHQLAKVDLERANKQAEDEYNKAMSDYDEAHGPKKATVKVPNKEKEAMKEKAKKLYEQGNLGKGAPKYAAQKKVAGEVADRERAKKKEAIDKKLGHKANPFTDEEKEKIKKWAEAKRKPLGARARKQGGGDA